MNEHFHSWRHYKKDKYFCNGPRCYIKSDLILLDGKLASCPRCKSTFVIATELIKNGDGIYCNECIGIEGSELTLEKQSKVLRAEIEEKLINLQKEVFERLEKRAQSLSKQEKELESNKELVQELAKKLDLREERLDKREKRLLELARRYRTTLYQKRLEIEKQSLQFYKPKEVETPEGLKPQEELAESILDALKKEIGL